MNNENTANDTALVTPIDLFLRFLTHEKKEWEIAGDKDNPVFAYMERGVRRRTSLVGGFFSAGWLTDAVKRPCDKVFAEIVTTGRADKNTEANRAVIELLQLCEGVARPGNQPHYRTPQMFQITAQDCDAARKQPEQFRVCTPDAPDKLIIPRLQMLRWYGAMSTILEDDTARKSMGNLVPYFKKFNPNAGNPSETKWFWSNEEVQEWESVQPKEWHWTDAQEHAVAQLNEVYDLIQHAWYFVMVGENDFLGRVADGVITLPYNLTVPTRGLTVAPTISFNEWMHEHGFVKSYRDVERGKIERDAHSKRTSSLSNSPVTWFEIFFVEKNDDDYEKNLPCNDVHWRISISKEEKSKSHLLKGLAAHVAHYENTKTQMEYYFAPIIPGEHGNDYIAHGENVPLQYKKENEIERLAREVERLNVTNMFALTHGSFISKLYYAPPAAAPTGGSEAEEKTQSQEQVKSKGKRERKPIGFNDWLCNYYDEHELDHQDHRKGGYGAMYEKAAKEATKKWGRTWNGKTLGRYMRDAVNRRNRSNQITPVSVPHPRITGGDHEPTDEEIRDATGGLKL